MDEELEEIVEELDKLKGGDMESEHVNATGLVLRALALSSLGGQKVADAFRRADDRIGFWKPSPEEAIAKDGICEHDWFLHSIQTCLKCGAKEEFG